MTDTNQALIDEAQSHGTDLERKLAEAAEARCKNWIDQVNRQARETADLKVERDALTALLQEWLGLPIGDPEVKDRAPKGILERAPWLLAASDLTLRTSKALAPRPSGEAEPECTCQDPEPVSGPARVSNDCPVHNDNPDCQGCGAPYLSGHEPGCPLAQGEAPACKTCGGSGTVYTHPDETEVGCAPGSSAQPCPDCSVSPPPAHRTCQDCKRVNEEIDDCPDYTCPFAQGEDEPDEPRICHHCGEDGQHAPNCMFAQGEDEHQ